ncbi:UNVERIFIED_CONTAM: hypothetical protein K2H54_009778 [Gekko kuhli]
MDSQEAGMSGAFPSMHRRRIDVYLPTCQPEDPGTRDASVQVGVTYEDKATQWEEREEADPSLDKPSGANTTATSCPPGPASSRQAINNLLRLPWSEIFQKRVREFPKSKISQKDKITKDS